MAVPATTLNGAINNSVTTITVRDAVGFATSAETDDLIQIGTEYLLVTAGMGTTSWTVTRAYASSTAASAIDGATVTRLERKYTDASRLVAMSKAPTTDYAYLQVCAEQANSWLIAEVGRFFGPSTDTSRTFDVERDSDTVVRIPGGVRTVTTLKARLIEAGTLTTVTSTDYVLRPKSWDLIDGLTYDSIELINRPASLMHFTAGRDMIEVTSSTFGPASPPNALRRIADTVGWWLYQSRASGMGGVVGSLETGELVVNRVLTGADWHTIKLYRGVGPSLYAMPAF